MERNGSVPLASSRHNKYLRCVAHAGRSELDVENAWTKCWIRYGRLEKVWNVVIWLFGEERRNSFPSLCDAFGQILSWNVRHTCKRSSDSFRGVAKDHQKTRLQRYLSTGYVDSSSPRKSPRTTAQTRVWVYSTPGGSREAVPHALRDNMHNCRNIKTSSYRRCLTSAGLNGSPMPPTHSQLRRYGISIRLKQDRLNQTLSISADEVMST